MENTQENKFGAALREVRRECRKTLRDAAELWSVKVGYVCDVELGRRPPPSRDRIEALMKEWHREDQVNHLLELAAERRDAIEWRPRDAEERGVLVALDRALDGAERASVLAGIKDILNKPK